VWVTGLVVPAAEPSPKSQLKECGAVPPETVAVKVTGLPTVGLALTVKVTASPVEGGATLIVWVDGAVAEFASVTVRVTVSLPDEA